MENIEDIVKTIKNPNTGISLFEENRLIEYGAKGDNFELIYSRDGISPDQKRSIESAVIEAFSKLYDASKILISTKSKNSSDVYTSTEMPSKPEKETANLKVGHEQAQAKKRVPGVKNLLAIASGKGGVGKSSVSVNLALSLHKKGYKVGIIDADIYGPSIPMMLGGRADKPQSTEEKKILPIQKEGISFISFGLFVEEKEPVIWRGPMLGGVLNQFLFDVKWGELDYLLIDLPPGTGDVQLSMVQNTNVDGVVIVSTPQEVAMLDALKALNMFKKMKTPIIGMVENMSSFICDDCDKEHFIFGKSGVETKTKELGINFLGKIPLDTAMRECADSGTPYMTLSENSTRKGYMAYMDLATEVTKYDANAKKSFFSKITGK